MSTEEQEFPEAGELPAEGSQPNAAPEQEKASEKTEVEVLRADLEKAQAELAAVNDQLLRKAADFDNYRKRMLKEKEEAQTFANSALLSDLVQVLDDFDRAIRSSEKARDYQSLHTGIVMIEGQFASMLERKYHLKRFDSLGEPFHPDYHEAISMEPQQDGKESIVVEEYQKGYKLHDRVLRTSRVKVGHSTGEAAEAATQQEKK